MKTETITNLRDRKISHRIPTTTPNVMIRYDTYHHSGNYIRSVHRIECREGFESCILGDRRDSYRRIEPCARYTARRLEELAGLSMAEVLAVASAHNLTIDPEAA